VPETAPPEGDQFDENQLVVVRGIKKDDGTTGPAESLDDIIAGLDDDDEQPKTASTLESGLRGAVLIRSDLNEVKAQVASHVALAAQVLVVSLAIATMFAWFFQQAITTPIVDLVQGAERIAEENDYSFRVTKHGEDEHGLLCDAFNEMLKQLEIGRNALQTAHDEMEQRVVSRTSDLNEALVAAEAANKSKSDFLANMSHEIRTPMSSILGYAELLGEETDLSLVGRERIDTVIRNGHHLTSIINAILDVSKIEAGKMTVESRPCSVPELLAGIASLMRARASEKGLDFRLWVEGDVPLTIHSDPTCIRQILVNLVGNAVKFTEKGSVRVVASMTGTSEKPMIRFRVIDTGIGFTPDQEKRLFNAFTQADETMTRRFGGTGLGLTISKGLAQLLGGDIVVQSELNKGSEFVVELETGEIDGVEHFQNADEAIRTIQCDQPTSKALPTNLTGRILLVEDGLDNQRLIAFLLRKSGLEVSVAENGAVGRSHALDAWQKGRPFDVVLMDMQMPVLDGYQATAKLRDEGYDGPVVALTAHAMSHDRAKCLAAGCDDFLTKPVDRHHLIETISRWLKADKGASPDACQPTS
jgi:signal transduction histidine kinase/ActR/RegA family two-component response regulator